jgi:hypothetical protein
VLSRAPVTSAGALAASLADAVLWSVDTVRPDGLRVVVSELNAAGYQQPISRKTPVLSVAQLTAIATSGTWAKLG